MGSFETIDIELCQDCLIYLANGEYEPPDPKYWPDEPASMEELQERIDVYWPPEEEWQLIAGGRCEYCEDEEEECEGSFSWTSCDCCGSGLGGNRYHGTAMRRIEQ
jgi:hypothetical protein